MENHSISSTTNSSSSTLLHSRDAVLKYIKQSLQVFYDAGTITRVQYVDICKSILYRTMNSPYGSPNWTPQVLMQEIAQRVSECAANGAEGGHHHQHFVDNNTSLTTIASTPNHRQTPDDEAYSNRQQQQQQLWNTGYSPAPSQINNKTIPPLAPQPHNQQQQQQNSNLVNLMMAMSSNKPNSSQSTQQLPFALLLEELELSERRNLGEHEESQRFTLRHSLMVTTTVMRLMTGTATTPQLPKRRVGDAGDMVMATNDIKNNNDQAREEVTVRVPLSVIQEQQVALNQLLSQQTNNSGTPVNNNSNNNNNQKNGHYYYSFAAASSSQQNQHVPDISNNTGFRNDNSISVSQLPACNHTTSSAVKPAIIASTRKRSNSPSARNTAANQTISSARTPSGKNGARQPPPPNASSSLHPCTKQEVVEFMRQILQPSYNAGLLPAEQFAEIVRDASAALFSIPPTAIDRGGYIATANGNAGDGPLHWKDFIRERIAGFFS